MLKRSTVMIAIVIVGIALWSPGLSGKPGSGTYHAAAIVYGPDAASGEVHAAGELAKDMEKVCGFSPRVVPADGFERKAREAVFYVGTADTNPELAKLVERGLLEVSDADPGPEAFVIKSWPQNGEVAIAGCDERGTLYGVYHFSGEYLGIDPMEFWTGKKPEKMDGFVVPDIALREDPPVFKYRGYFDNDSDMIANYSGKKLVIEFELWKEIIDSAARLRYNFIDLFDTLGRTEFWVWPYYTRKFPGYKTDLDLVDRIMDYAHEKGMMVQVSTYLGYQFHHLPYEKRCLSLFHDDWIEAYRVLLEETPVGRADIIYHSPRDPWWDRPYWCTYEKMLGINSGKLHTRLINDLYKLVKKNNPEAVMMCLFWSDGKKHWESGVFKPDPGINMVWADDGYGRIPEWPDDFRGYDFGIYMHAGFYLNHVMQDPYPARIKDTTMEAVKRDMDLYYFVNGQDFKHFLLNLEACARAAWDPDGYNPEEFYHEWTSRYFGNEAAPTIIESLKSLHKASDLAGGFTGMTIQTYIALEMGNLGVPYCKDYSYTGPALEAAEKSLALAEQARGKVREDMLMAYDDQILFPAKIYLENLRLHASVACLVDARCKTINPIAPIGETVDAIKARKECKRSAPEHLEKLRQLLEQGSGWDKWEGWTDPENFRKYQPPPTMKELKRGTRLF